MARRILDETTKSTFASDDYLYMDGQTDGASKITPDNLVRNTTVAQQLAQHIADAEEEVENIQTNIGTLQTDVGDVKADIGDLSELETTDKSSLVGAINEARGTGGSGGSGLTEDVKDALLDCFEHVAWIDEHGQNYYDALEDALYPPANLVSISAVYTQSGAVYETDSLDVLKADLVVTAHMSDSTSQTVTTYTLSGTLTEGTSTITVTYGGKTTTFNVTVSGVSILTATSVKNTLPTINSSGDLVTTTSGGSTYCGFVFDESVSGGTIDIAWDTDDHSTLDIRVALETNDAYSALGSHTQNNATYGRTAETTGYSNAFYWYEWGKSYQDTGTNPAMYMPYSNTGHCTVKVPDGYKALVVSVRRNTGSTSANGLPTDNNSFKTWAFENIAVKLIGGVPVE